MRSRCLRTFLPALLVATVHAQSEITTFDAPVGASAYGRNAMALLDDLDGDGLREPAIVVSSSTGWRIEVRSSDTFAPLMAIGVGSTAEIRSLSAIGDLDGDGYRDLIAGIPEHSIGATERGLVEIYSGRTGKRLRSTAGPAAGDRFGEAVCAIGDADLDGVPDYAVGMPGYDSALPFLGGPDAGAVSVRSGADGSQLYHRTTTAGARMGTSLALLGDLDGDGRPSIAIGAPGGDKVFIAEVLGNTSSILLNSTSGSDFGRALASVGDLDGDGHRDLVVGQPEFMLPSHSTPGGRIAVYGSVSGTLLFSELGPEDFRFGFDVGDAGDVNGDGVHDVIVSSLGFFPWGYNDPSGVRRVLSGADGSLLETMVAGGGAWSFALAEDADGDGVDDLWMLSAWFGSIRRDPVPGDGEWMPPTSLSSGQRFGEAVTILDDLDGDGRPEVAVGGPNVQPGGLANQGCVRVYSGTSVLYSYDGAWGEQLGTAVAALGDLDGDGIGDFAIGRPRAKFGHVLRPGAVSVYSGASGQLLRNHFGVAFGDRFGAAIARVPDTNGDGVDDYAIGAPAVTVAAGHVQAGRVSLYSGATGTLRYSIDGTIRNGMFGAALAGSEDTDGDGRGELLIGAPGEWSTLLAAGAGRVHRRSGSSAQLLGVVVGGQAKMRFGSSVASVADYNGDGYPEWIAGAPFYQSTERGDGRVRMFDGATGATIWSDNGAFGSRLGSSIVACGDVDNDGVDDFAVGEPEAYDFVNSIHAGRVRLYSGATQSWYQYLAGTEDHARFGTSVAGGQDLDGDRLPDFVVGSPDGLVSMPSGSGSVHAGVASTWTARELGSEAFGSGAAGCAGDHNLTLHFTVKPGQLMKLRFSGVAPTAFPLLGIGVRLPAGVPVLGFLAHVQSQITLGLPLPSGSHGTHNEPIPNDPNLVGAELHLQLYGVWLSGCPQLPFDISSSNGLTVTVQ